LKTKLAALIGESVRFPLKMSPSQNFAQRSAQTLREHFMFFVNHMSAFPSLPELVMAEFEQTLMVMFLHANRHNYSDLLELQPTDVAAWQVRRAEGYIEANWDKPISLEALAATMEVSLRSLFRNFRKVSGHSPSDFLKQVRLRHARRLLQRPEAITTITDIAYACGFADIGRFNRAYVQAFGEQPLATIARAGGIGVARH
jgi:transcriptional regulator GlxA family with amidase domain